MRPRCAATFEAFARSVADHERDVRSDLATARDEHAATRRRALREELAAALARQQQDLAQQQQGMAQQLAAHGRPAAASS